MKKWFTLETYVLVWIEQSKILFYDYIRYTKLYFNGDKESISFFLKLTNYLSLYCVEITAEIENNSNFKRIKKTLINNHMANEILADEKNRPINLPPKLFLSNYVGKGNLQKHDYYDHFVLNNISEISVYLTGVCRYNCTYCSMYVNQFNHCLKNEDTIKEQDVSNLCKQISCLYVKKVNILGGDLIALMDTYDFSIPFRSLYGVLKVYHINFYHVDIGKMKYILDKDAYSLFKISIDSISFSTEISDLIKSLILYKERIIWQFIITDYSSYQMIDSFLKNLKSTIEYEFKLFYNGKNDEFINENTLLEEDEINSFEVSLKNVYANTVINTNYFGKITISSSGYIYDNLNFLPVGTMNDPLDKLIHEIIKNGNSWRLTRDHGECSVCVNKFLCPPPDNLQIIRKLNKICKG